MPLGGRVMQDVGQGIDVMLGKPRRNGHVRSVHPLGIREETHVDSRIPRQPNDHQPYPVASQSRYYDTGPRVAGVRESPGVGEELRTLDDVTPDEIYQLFKARAVKVNALGEEERLKRETANKKLLPDDMLATIDRNRVEIEALLPTIAGHEVTVANSMAVFGEKGWEDLRSTAEKWSRAYREQDAYSAFVHGNNFINGIMSIMPAMLQIIEKYKEVVPLAQENYELLLQLHADKRAECDKLRQDFSIYEPKGIILSQEKRIKDLEIELMRRSANQANPTKAAGGTSTPPAADDEEVTGPRCIGGYKDDDEACPTCTYIKSCKKLTEEGGVEEVEEEGEETKPIAKADPMFGNLKVRPKR